MPPKKSRKGFRGSLRRAFLVPQRYGIGPDKLRERLREMAAALSRWDITPTIPATAITLDRHPEIAQDLTTFDPAIHGYRHLPYAGLSAQEQAKDLDAARLAFARHGLDAKGFRAPYLSGNPTTLQILRERGFCFDSTACAFVLPMDHPLAARALRLVEARYGLATSGTAVPSYEQGLVELPVALPDDEVLADGLGIRKTSTLQGVLEHMLDASANVEGLLVLQIHPERFHLFENPLREVVARAANVGAWCASLSEIAAWVRDNPALPLRWPHGHAMALAVTGDLDAVALGDFARRGSGG